MSIRQLRPWRVDQSRLGAFDAFPGSPGTVDPRLTEAIRGLWTRSPELSARGPAPRWLLPMVLVSAFVIGFGVMLDWRGSLAVIGGALTVPFAAGGFLRLLGAVEILRRPAMGAKRSRLPMPRLPAPLPSYAVLVPLYDEAEVLDTLVRHLGALDYPRDRLQILLVLEARDKATRRAVEAAALPAHFSVVVVPGGGPRTKPKALDYALTFVECQCVVVFDAEDRPEPDQLRMAAQAFDRGGANLACLQARLNVYNFSRGFFPRQFALEYSALFDGLLPALERLGCPIPLGGTSNHFSGIA